MESKNWYIIILVITLIVTIFSLINFIQFLNIRNDPDPTVAENSSLALIILNGIVCFGGFIIALYCIWQLIKKDNFEPKVFQAYRNEYKRTNADVPVNPLDACDEIAAIANAEENNDPKYKDLKKDFEDTRRYNKLNIDMKKFAADCKEYGITQEAYEEKFDLKLKERESNISADAIEGLTGKRPGMDGSDNGAPAPAGGMGRAVPVGGMDRGAPVGGMDRGAVPAAPGGMDRGAPRGGMGAPRGMDRGAVPAAPGGMGRGAIPVAPGGMDRGAIPVAPGGMDRGAVPAAPGGMGRGAIPVAPVTDIQRLFKQRECMTHNRNETACNDDTGNNCTYNVGTQRCKTSV